MKKHIGLLLLNTGTPEKADKKHVARYLREFLMDPRVIDLPWIIRWPLIHGLIIPSRLRASTEAYRSIWTDQGLPLLANSQALVQQLTQKLTQQYPNNHYTVVLGMRYGRPSIPEVIQQLQQAQCDHVIIFPLFPQYASASTGSVIAECMRIFSQSWNIPAMSIHTDFYDDPRFIAAYAHIIQRVQKNEQFILFSYHGLPWRHIEKSGCAESAQCKKTVPQDHGCPAMITKNRFCYRAQCYATSRLLAEKLALSSEQYGTAFQSRLGKTPWITPYSDEYLKVLIYKGITSLLVVCPAFTADCLETLEEIGMRLKVQWHDLGGKNFTLAPCLNADDQWVEALSDMLGKHCI